MDLLFLVMMIVVIAVAGFLLWLFCTLCTRRQQQQVPINVERARYDDGVDWRRREVHRAIQATGDGWFYNDRASNSNGEVFYFRLWESARKKHIFKVRNNDMSINFKSLLLLWWVKDISHFQGPMSVQSAVEMSMQRDDNVFSNTVFAAPSAFDKLCIPGQRQCRVMSRERFRAVGCCKDEASGVWTGVEMHGRFYVVFDMRGHLMYRATMATRVSNWRAL